MTPAVHCFIDADQIATIRFNEPGKSVNTLPREVLAQLSEVITQVETNASLEGVIFASEKPTTYLAGADLKKVRDMDLPTFERYLVEGQELYNRIEHLAIPTLAAINGHCLGGGLELALSCRLRIAADNPATLIGLPETAIGLIPAWGGTVRLSRLIGHAAAVPLLLESRKFSPEEALRLGIVDALAAPADLLASARQAITESIKTRAAGAPEKKPSAGQLSVQTQGDCETSLEEAIARTRPELSPDQVSISAVDHLIDVLRMGCRGGFEAGLRAEREAASAIFQLPECRERLDRFFTRK